MKRTYRAIKLPSINDFTPRSLFALERASEAAARLTAVDIDAWERIAAVVSGSEADGDLKTNFTDEFVECVKLAEDELCLELWSRSGVPRYKGSRTRMEKVHFDNCSREIRTSLSEEARRYKGFGIALCYAASALRGTQTDFRLDDVFVTSGEPDYWEFPPSDEIDVSLEQLYLLLCKKGVPPLWRSIVSLMVVNFVHPFIDGNGRTSRVLFNTLLGTKEETYLPLKELQCVSRGGQLIKMKRAWLYGDWNPLMRLFCTYIDMVALVSSGLAIR